MYYQTLHSQLHMHAHKPGAITWYMRPHLHIISYGCFTYVHACTYIHTYIHKYIHTCAYIVMYSNVQASVSRNPRIIVLMPASLGPDIESVCLWKLLYSIHYIQSTNCLFGQDERAHDASNGGVLVTLAAVHCEAFVENISFNFQHAGKRRK